VDARSLSAGKSSVPEHDVDTTFVRHPLARGALSLRVSVAWVAALVLVAVVGTALLSPLALLFFLAAVATQVVYCALRSVTPWKTVLSGVMVGFGGVAGWVAVAPLHWGALSVFVFLACWEVGGRNIVNDLSDLESDASVGIRTIASVHGEAAAARVAAAVAGACLVSTALLPMPPAAIALALAFGVWSLAWPVRSLLRRPTPAQAASFFNHASPYPDLVLLAALLGLAMGGA
jgi:4-hydroxybenzoate polyprenyltransferase